MFAHGVRSSKKSSLNRTRRVSLPAARMSVVESPLPPYNGANVWFVKNSAHSSRRCGGVRVTAKLVEWPLSSTKTGANVWFVICTNGDDSWMSAGGRSGSEENEAELKR